MLGNVNIINSQFSTIFSSSNTDHQNFNFSHMLISIERLSESFEVVFCMSDNEFLSPRKEFHRMLLSQITCKFFKSGNNKFQLLSLFQFLLLFFEVYDHRSNSRECLK